MVMKAYSIFHKLQDFTIRCCLISYQGYVCVCVYVCVRERERGRERESKYYRVLKTVLSFSYQTDYNKRVQIVDDTFSVSSLPNRYCYIVFNTLPWPNAYIFYCSQCPRLSFFSESLFYHRPPSMLLLFPHLASLCLFLSVILFFAVTPRLFQFFFC